MEVIKAILISLSPFVLISVVGGFFYFLKNKSVSEAELNFFKEKEGVLSEKNSEIGFYKSLAKSYKTELDCYKLGLGLLPGDRKRAAGDLWDRASSGDETAYYILLELMDAELDIDLDQLPEDLTLIEKKLR